MSLMFNPFMGGQENRSQKHDVVKYATEKVMGKRRETGELNLKRLSPIHRRIIAMHVKGMAVGEIAFVTHYSEVRIRTILKDPLAQAYIQLHCDVGVEQDLLALLPMSVDAIRDALDDNETKVRLMAADRVLKATGRYERQTEERETAEDVIARALGIMQTQADTIKDVTKERNLRVIGGNAIDISEADSADGGSPIVDNPESED